jgi:hypothetical protein
MRLLKFLAVLAIIGFAAHWWKGHQMRVSTAAATSDSGFVKAVLVDGASRNTVLILAPPDCPSEEAQRASRLAERLTQMGIPYVMGSGFTVSSDDPSDEARAGMDRAVAVFQKGAPAVFVYDMAKSNPSAEEVAIEYNKARAGNRHLP